MFRWGRDDQGASSVEHGLLLGAIAVVALPVLFVLGQLVHDSFNSACEGLASDDRSCATSPGGGGGGGGGPEAIVPGGATGVAEASVNSWATGQWPGRGAAQTDCDEVTERPAPAVNTTDCTVSFANGETQRVEVSWVAGSGNHTMRPLPA